MLFRSATSGVGTAAAVFRLLPQALFLALVVASGLHFTSKNFEKTATKPGKKGVKQFKNKQQGDRIPKNKFQQANKFNQKRKFQPDSKSDGKH